MLPGSGEAAYGWLREAMKDSDKAAGIRPPDDDSAILRWNTCARVIMSEPEVAAQARADLCEKELLSWRIKNLSR